MDPPIFRAYPCPSKDEERHQTNAYGPAPVRPQFPWQFFAPNNAAKLAEVRQRRLGETQEKLLKLREEQVNAGKHVEEGTVHSGQRDR
jgi:hypothetical protein